MRNLARHYCRSDAYLTIDLSVDNRTMINLCMRRNYSDRLSMTLKIYHANFNSYSVRIHSPYLRSKHDFHEEKGVKFSLHHTLFQLNYLANDSISSLFSSMKEADKHSDLKNTFQWRHKQINIHSTDFRLLIHL